MRLVRISTLVIMAAAAFLAAPGAGYSADGTVTFQSLLEEMIDRDAAARFPAPAYTCRQQSSYDPKTVTPDDPAGWFANDDWSHFRRSEQRNGREEWVMLDAPCPGCVVRIWATAFNPRGTIRVYIDDAEKPAIEERIDRLIGGDALVGDPFSAVRARGMNFYLPIPYAKHCVITYDRPNFWKTQKQEDQLYYQVNYRTYEPGTKVESFSRQVLDAAKGTLAKVQKTLSAARDATSGVTDLRKRSETLKPGESMEVPLAGPGAIRALVVNVEAADMAAASRETVLEVDCDGAATVWCPVGDFFGSGVGVNPFQTWWQRVEKGGMVCRWVMPYRRSCTVRLKNLGQKGVEATLGLGFGKWNWDHRSMHFHANWRHECPLDTTAKQDWNYVAVQGRGVYMGDVLAVVNPVEAWWGEGDEKVYVDGEKFPSHIGTGTEDYYGYAWCTPEFFCDPFHAQPRAEGPGNRGHVTNTRVRILDGIPFAKSLKFDMEVWHWDQVNVSYAATTYWYGAPGATSNRTPAPEMAKDCVPAPPKPPKVEGAIEAEELKIVEKTGGITEIQQGRQFKWSAGKQLWWRDGKPGDRLVLSFPVAKAGKYAIDAALTKAIDYGIVRISLDGKPLGDRIDLINDGVITTHARLGTGELAAGDHRLTVEIVGSNPTAVPRHMFGLDYLKLEPAGQ